MIEYLKAENAILRAKLSKQVSVDAKERRTLIQFAKPLGDKIKELATIVSPQTLLRWINEESKPKSQPQSNIPERKPGRPKIVENTRELVIRLASENASATLPFPGVDSRHEAGELPPDVLPFPVMIDCEARLGGKLRH